MQETTLSCPREKRQAISSTSGFTLIEMMVTIALLAILTGIALPSMQQMLADSRVGSASNHLLASLNFSRSEALKRGAQISLCKSDNPSATQPRCATSGNWSNGWLVFIDEDATGTPGTLDSNDVLLRVAQMQQTGTSISGDTKVANFISFDRRGRTSTNGLLTLSLSGQQRIIDIAATGRVRVCKGSC